MSYANPISVLQERCQGGGHGIPVYEELFLFGSNGFHMEVKCYNKSASGTGFNKKEAKKNAAQAMLEQLDGKSPSSPKVQTNNTHMISPNSSMTSNSKNFIGELQEFCVAMQKPVPRFTEVSITGPDHMRTFSVECSLLQFKTIGTGSCKSEAKKFAAEKMLTLAQSQLLKPMSSSSPFKPNGSSPSVPSPGKDNSSYGQRAAAYSPAHQATSRSSPFKPITRSPNVPSPGQDNSSFGQRASTYSPGQSPFSSKGSTPVFSSGAERYSPPIMAGAGQRSPPTISGPGQYSPPVISGAGQYTYEMDSTNSISPSSSDESFKSFIPGESPSSNTDPRASTRNGIFGRPQDQNDIADIEKKLRNLQMVGHKNSQHQRLFENPLSPNDPDLGQKFEKLCLEAGMKHVIVDLPHDDKNSEYHSLIRVLSVPADHFFGSGKTKAQSRQNAFYNALSTYKLMGSLTVRGQIEE